MEFGANIADRTNGVIVENDTSGNYATRPSANGGNHDQTRRTNSPVAITTPHAPASFWVGGN